MNADVKQQRASWKPGLQGAGKKSRVVSLPPTLSSNSTQSVYSNPSNRFSSSGSPPIIDFTEWADNFRGQRFGFSIPSELSPDTPRFGPHSMFRSDSGGSRGWRIDHSVLLSALRPLLDSQDKGLENVLNVKEIATLHLQDRDSLLKRTQMGSVSSVMISPCLDGVIGKRLSAVFLHASLPVPIAGTEHFIPTIVVKCVEELYRTGLYQPQLFRRTPNFVRVEELVEIYDHREPSSSIRIARHRPHQNQLYNPPSANAFGAQTSLHMETTENICALLRTFLQYLPEPILSPCLFEAIWNCCGVRQEAFHSTLHHGSSQTRAPLGSSISSEELVRVHIAQIMVHLLPTPNFSLMVYIFSFFSQVVMVHEENGLAIDDVASMFGAIIFGGATERIVSWMDSKPKPRGEIMMRWFLRRWRQIYHGLFPYDDEGRPLSSGIRRLSPTNDTSNKSGAMVRPASGYFGLKDTTTVSKHDMLPSVFKQAEEQELPRCSPEGLSTEPIPVPPLKTHSDGVRDHKTSVPPSLRASGSSHLASNYLEEVWPHLTSDRQMTLNERMLDGMLEHLATGSSTMSRQRSNSVPCRLKPSTLPVNTASRSTDSAILHRQLIFATQRIAKLEGWMHENQQILQDTITENQRIKQDKSMLEVRVKDLEVELELRDVQYKEGEARVRKGLKETVEGVVRERDEARGIVSEIQRLSLSGIVSAGTRASTVGGGAGGGGFMRN